MKDIQEIIQKVKDAGIVGRGGAGFPTHVKINSKVDTVIGNGTECEPLLNSDKAFMKNFTDDICKGLDIVRTATGAQRVVIALKGDYKEVVNNVKKIAKNYNIEVFEIDNYYPAGDEHVLVNSITGKVIPEGGIPLNVGVVVNNVITLRDIAKAIYQNIPVIDRPLTIHGEVGRAVNVVLPVGTPIIRALQIADGATIDNFAVIEGGPAMGRVVKNLLDPITKTTSGLIVLPDEHPLVLRKESSIEREVKLSKTVCCQCQFCTQLCPRFLLGHEIQPHLVMRALNYSGFVDSPSEFITAAYLCCLCGVCEIYACPLMLSPRKVFNEFKNYLSKEGIKNPHTRNEIIKHPQQEMRKIPSNRIAAKLGLYDYLHKGVETDWGEYEIDKVIIPLKQHTGAPSIPVVKIGEKVEAGSLIGEIPEGKLGARIHASIGGIVEAVTRNEIIIKKR